MKTINWNPSETQVHLAKEAYEKDHITELTPPWLDNETMMLAYIAQHFDINAEEIWNVAINIL